MMRSGPSSPAERQLARFQGSIERFSNPLAQAQNHNLGRNVRVVEVLAYLGWLRLKGVKLDGAIQCTAAIRQNFKSTSGMQAAHFLPGQLKIGGRPVWRYATAPAIASQLEFLFGEVEHLPAPFNHADTEAEASGKPGGLCAAFIAAATRLLRKPMPQHDWLQPAFEEWHRMALLALRNAQNAKASRPGLPELEMTGYNEFTAASLQAVGNAGDTLWNRDEAARVLGYYLQHQQGCDWKKMASICAGSLAGIERSFK